MGFCFGFVQKTVLRIQRLLCYCWAVLTYNKAFSISPTTLRMSGLGEDKKLGKDTVGTPDPSWPKDIPNHMASCSRYKIGHRTRKWKKLWVMAFAISSHFCMWWSLAFLEMADHLPDDFPLFVYAAFASHIKLRLSQPMSFLTFLLSLFNSLPHPTEGSELCCSLAASWG